jgi:hypothetical protein
VDARIVGTCAKLAASAQPRKFRPMLASPARRSRPIPGFRCIVLGSLLLLAGLPAVAAPHPKLTKPLDEARKVRHVAVMFEQSEVAVDDVDVNGGATGGLIGALIEVGMESKMTSNRQQAIAPVRDALLDLGFETAFVDALRRHMPDTAVASDADYAVIRNEVEWRDVLRAHRGSTVMLVNARYAFEQNFDIAYVHAFASIVPSAKTLPDEAAWDKLSNRKRRLYLSDPLHVGSYYASHAEHPLFGKREKKVEGEARFETNASRWSRDGGAPARAAFTAAADELAMLVRRDVARELPAPGPKSRALLPNRFFAPLARKLARVDQTQGRTLLQDKYDLYWVDATQIKP